MKSTLKRLNRTYVVLGFAIAVVIGLTVCSIVPVMAFIFSVFALVAVGVGMWIKDIYEDDVAEQEELRQQREASHARALVTR